MPNFIKLHERYHQLLDNGDRAQIKRATEPDDLRDLPAFYHLIGHASEKELKQLSRFAFFLPLIEDHLKDVDSLGRQLSQKKINEKRLFHIIRSDSPNDLIQLKRVLQQAKLSKINWQIFGEALYFWGKRQKNQLMQDFYLQPHLMEEE
jgi:CRISPR system Cascade subunit CasB